MSPIVLCAALALALPPSPSHQRRAGGPNVGAPAPDFKLKRSDGGEVRLSSFKGKRPVVLVFGSYT